MNNVKAIKTLYAYEDGDNITPGMGVQIAAGHGLQQYYNPDTWQVTNTDFRQFPPTLFPQAYSGRAGAIIVPASGGQWYYNTISDNAGILDENGNVKAAFASTFKATTVTMNGKTFPGLTIKDNLVNATNKDGTDKHIFFVGSYDGKSFTCSQLIPVQAVVGEAYQLMVSVEGANGTGDEVLSDEQDWIRYTASLQMMSTGTDIADAVISFEHLENDAWVAVTNQEGMTEVSGNKLKLYESAVDGSEMYRAKATYLGKTFFQTMNPTDEHDPYYIDDGCSILGDFVTRNDTVSFSPSVYKRHYGLGEEDEDVTVSEGWTFTYTLVSQKDKSVITEINQDNITFNELKKYGGISTRIIASRK